MRGLTESERRTLIKACAPLRSGVDPSTGEVSHEDESFESLMSRGLASWIEYDAEWLVFQATDLGHLALRVDTLVRESECKSC